MSRAEQWIGTILGGRYQITAGRDAATSESSATGTLAFDGIDIAANREVGLRVTPLERLVDPGLGATTASDALDSFQRQCEVGRSIHHPTIEEILDFGDDTVNGERHVYVVAERLAGGSLRDFLDRGRRLTPSQALVVGIDACRALDGAARQGIVHGDLRPARLVFGLDRRVRVVGFGAPLRDVASMSVDQANYSAPELANGMQRSSSSDVYALALTLVEAMTGEVPFSSDSVAGAFAAREGKLLPVNADFGPLAQVLERAGRPEPDQRFSPREFGQALVQAAEKLPRPTPIDIVGTGLFDLEVAASDPSQPSTRSDSTGSGGIESPAFGLTRTDSAPPLVIRTTPDLPIDLPEPVTPDGVPLLDPSGNQRMLVIGGDATGPVAIDVDLLAKLSAADPTAQTPAPKKRRWARKITVFALVLALLGGGGFAAYNTVLNPSNSVPDLIAKPEGEARNFVSQFGWKVVVEKERSDDVDTGEVIRTYPIAGASLKKRGTLTLYVSEGPSLVELKEVKGLTAADAKAQLETAGLEVVGSFAPDELIPVGSIVKWSIPDQPTLKAGDSVVRGAKINLVVSSGPAPRDVPELIGLTLDEATKKLADLGLRVIRGKDSPTVSVPAGRVGSQFPIKGFKVAKGGSVVVSISAGQRRTLIPTIYNRKYSVVKERLEKAGMRIGRVTGNRNSTLLKASINGRQVYDLSRVVVGETVDLVFRS